MPLIAVRGSHDVIAVYTRAPAKRARPENCLAGSPTAEQAGIHVFTPTSLKSDAVQAQLARFRRRPRHCGRLWAYFAASDWLNVPPMGCLNIHAFFLPRWRGAAPIQRAIMAGDSETGIAIMQMAAGLDTGDVLLQKTTPIADDETAASLHDRLSAIGRAAITEDFGGRKIDACAASTDRWHVPMRKKSTRPRRLDFSRPAKELDAGAYSRPVAVSRRMVRGQWQTDKTARRAGRQWRCCAQLADEGAIVFCGAGCVAACARATGRQGSNARR